MPLSYTAVRNAKPTEKPQKLADTEGLYLYISPTGGKLWRMDYRFAGKRKTLSFGKYPAVGLKDARNRRGKAKELLADGIDPSEQKKSISASLLRKSGAVRTRLEPLLLTSLLPLHPPGELRVAEWSEVNFDDSILVIPWQRMKTRKLSQKDHRVPLARQVVPLLQELQDFSSNSRFLFPSIRAKTDAISDAGSRNALRDMGYDQKTMTLHGFRSIASTRLNEMGYHPDLVEAQRAHKAPDAVRMVYNRAEYSEERRKLMQEWADYLNDLRGKF